MNKRIFLTIFLIILGEHAIAEEGGGFTVVVADAKVEFVLDKSLKPVPDSFVFTHLMGALSHELRDGGVDIDDFASSFRYWDARARRYIKLSDIVTEIRLEPMDEERETVSMKIVQTTILNAKGLNDDARDALSTITEPDDGNVHRLRHEIVLLPSELRVRGTSFPINAQYSLVIWKAESDAGQESAERDL